MPAHSRLHRLALIFALFALPTLASAQTPNTQTAAPTKDTVLFDFEAGSFDGWTLTGDCWDKQPATPKTFVDKQGRFLVSGIVGSGYLTTLYKNAATTGKAISKDFVIDKPFLTFKIGGGRYPKEACLNLLVDGKIVRTETGTDSAELRPAYFDVYAFMGKTAHLEIVDATPNQQRGYIMLDDLRLSERIPSRMQTRLEKILNNFREQNQVPAIWAVVARQGKVTACVASGIRRQGNMTPVGLSDVVMIGSVSKTLTETLIDALVKRGIVSYEMRIRDIFPELARVSQHPCLDATISQILKHRGGFPRDCIPPVPNTKLTVQQKREWRYNALRCIIGLAPKGMSVLTHEGTIDFPTLQRQGGLPAVGVAGEKESYSNVGYVILGAIAERKANRDFDDLIAEYVYRPFGMRHAGMGFAISNPKTADNPVGHIPDTSQPTGLSTYDNWIENRETLRIYVKSAVGTKFVSQQGTFRVRRTARWLDRPRRRN